jgi:hypothetical protein
MPAHQLVDDAADHGVDVEGALGLAQGGVKHHLHQQVAQLLLVAGDVGALEGVEHLVGLLDEEGAQGLEGLLAIPRAAVGSEELGHDLDEAGEG